MGVGEGGGGAGGGKGLRTGGTQKYRICSKSACSRFYDAVLVVCGTAACHCTVPDLHPRPLFLTDEDTEINDSSELSPCTAQDADTGDDR